MKLGHYKGIKLTELALKKKFGRERERKPLFEDFGGFLSFSKRLLTPLNFMHLARALVATKILSKLSKCLF